MQVSCMFSPHVGFDVVNAFEVYFDRVLIVSVFDDEDRTIAQLKYFLIGFPVRRLCSFMRLCMSWSMVGSFFCDWCFGC